MIAPTPERRKLSATAICVEALVVYVRHWQMLVPLAIVVLAPQTVGNAIYDSAELDGVATLGDVAKLAEIGATIAINLGGEAIYAGIVAAVVVSWRRGERTPHLGTLIREIPIVTLVAVDLIVALGSALGVLLFVLPGLVFYALFAISPALIEIKGLGIRAALATSFRLVRGNFLRVLALVFFVLIFTDAAAAALESPVHGVPGEVATVLVVHAAVEPFQGLVTVLLAIALIERHPDRVP
jgi:hypothetical protein